MNRDGSSACNRGYLPQPLAPCLESANQAMKNNHISGARGVAIAITVDVLKFPFFFQLTKKVFVERSHAQKTNGVAHGLYGVRTGDHVLHRRDVEIGTLLGVDKMQIPFLDVQLSLRASFDSVETHKLDHFRWRGRLLRFRDGDRE